ncbi:hypothetical protein R1sor_014750 [Riccia sorocarpa]|uniref:SWIM-type domain-containing protein n=1 Tax=Riccia sorocarpa TaxID=122646 RepID=A0ABD3HC50_9MARC
MKTRVNDNLLLKPPRILGFQRKKLNCAEGKNAKSWNSLVFQPTFRYLSLSDVGSRFLLFPNFRSTIFAHYSRSRSCMRWGGMAAEEAANWVVASIRPATAGSPPFSSLTDDQILMLHFLFNKTLDKAVCIIEQGGVYRLVAEPSGRTVYQVMGNPKEHQHYVCFPDHFCSCHAFFFDIVSRGHQLCCKHQLAARLASTLQVFKHITVTDVELAQLLVDM